MLDKATCRTEALARRAAMDPQARRAASAAACRHALTILPRGAKIVSGYMAIRDELDARVLLDLVEARGLTIALPVVVGSGKPLMFRKFRLTDALTPGPMGVPQPAASAPTVEPDVMFIPLAAFDGAGDRLGYGAGYYDRTLAGLRARKPVAAFGLAFATQRVERVPTEPHDQRLDAVVTESGVVFAGAPAGERAG